MSSPTSPTPSPVDGVATLPSPRSVPDTVSRLTALLESKDLTIFTVVDHSGAAADVGVDMPDTKLVVFGSPAAGTPLMLAEPLVALDLPLKILVAADGTGAVTVSYNTPGYLTARYHLSDELRAPVDAIEALANAPSHPANDRPGGGGADRAGAPEARRGIVDSRGRRSKGPSLHGVEEDRLEGLARAVADETVECTARFSDVTSCFGCHLARYTAVGGTQNSRWQPETSPRTTSCSPRPASSLPVPAQVIEDRGPASLHP